MKVLCPQCDRLSELEQYRLDHGVLVVTCTKCGVASRTLTAVPAAVVGAPVSPVASPSPAPAVTDPYQSAMTPLPSSPRLLSTPGASNVVLLKTASTEAVEKAANAAQNNPFEVPAGLCPKCMTRKPERASSCGQCGLVFAMLDASSLEPPSWLADAWRELLLQWGEESRHDKLRKQAVQAEALAAVGRLYRLRLASMPDDPYALRGREEVVRLASVPVSVRQVAVAEPGSSKVKLIGVIIVLVTCVLAGAFLFRMLMASRGEP